MGGQSPEQGTGIREAQGEQRELRGHAGRHPDPRRPAPREKQGPAHGWLRLFLSAAPACEPPARRHRPEPPGNGAWEAVAGGPGTPGGLPGAVPPARGGAEGQAGRGGPHSLSPLGTVLLKAQRVTSCPGPPPPAVSPQAGGGGQDQEKAGGVPRGGGVRGRMPWVLWVTFCPA